MFSIDKKTYLSYGVKMACHVTSRHVTRNCLVAARCSDGSDSLGVTHPIFLQGIHGRAQGEPHNSPRPSPTLSASRKALKVCTTAESPPLAWRGEIWLCPFHVDESGEIHRRVPANDLYHFFLLTATTSCLCRR